MNGEPRRTLSDMFFAEVRHFEEIFRQGEQPSASEQQRQQQQQQQQQSQNAQNADALAELQKQIINATWNLIRRETGREVSSKFKEDISVIVESQQSAAEKMDELSNQVSDQASRQFVLVVRKAMSESLSELTTAFDDQTAKPLSDAIQAQRKAYQALLKLRAREHEVIQGQQQPPRPNNRRVLRGGKRSSRSISLNCRTTKIDTRNSD